MSTAAEWDNYLDESKVGATILSWRDRFDVSAYLRGELPPRPRPMLLRRQDGHGLFYEGRINEVHGEPESGKGFVLGAVEAEFLATGAAVLHLDFDVDGESVIQRVIAGGADPKWLEHLHLYEIADPLPMERGEPSEEGRMILDEYLSIPNLALVVIDGLNRAIELHARNPNEDPDIAWMYRQIVLPFSARLGATALVSDHVVKDRTNRGPWATGSQQKRAAIDGVSYEVVVKDKDQPAPGRVGRLVLKISKDRPGGVREHAQRDKGGDVACLFVIDGTDEDGTTVRILPASEWQGPTVIMERVSRFLEEKDDGTWWSQTKIEQGVKGKGEFKRQAIDKLVQLGYVERQGDPNAKGTPLHHKLVKPYREPKDYDPAG